MLTIILLYVLLLAMFGLGGYWLGAGRNNPYQQLFYQAQTQLVTHCGICLLIGHRRKEKGFVVIFARL
jgi:hypothetical protein